MKYFLIFFTILQLFCSCVKEEDDSDNECSSDCTTLKGKFVTLNNVPLPNIKVTMKYTHSDIFFYYSRKLVDTKSDQNGNFNKRFFIRDKELGNMAPGFFEIDIDDSSLDVRKYIRTNNLLNGFSMVVGSAIYQINNRDTIFDQTYYFPKKAFIKVNLNNFVRQQSTDSFEVQTLFPFGAKVGVNTLLNSEYSTGFSGWGNWVATNVDNQLIVFVAEGENNIIRITKRKNGVGMSQDYEVFVPPNNTIELTYNF